MKAKKCTILILNIKILFFILSSLLSVQGFSQVSAYKFSQNAGTYTELASPTDVVTNTSTSWDDGVVNNIPIGFTFNMNSVDYASCSVNYNGFITFGTTSSNSANSSPISSTRAYSSAISALGMNLYSNGTGNLANISYQTIGTAPNRIFVMQWKNVLRVAEPGYWNFQIRLHESTNAIEVIYGSCDATTSTALTAQVGLRGSVNTDFNNRRLTTSSAWLNNTVNGTGSSNSVNNYNTSLPASGTTFVWYPNYNYCIPLTTASDASKAYINKVRFLGTLQDVDNLNSGYSNSPKGYQNFTWKPDKSIQAQGNGINVYVETNSSAYYKAWVDWNNDGDFTDTDELVYDAQDILQVTTTFGLVIPSNALVGDHVLRIRVNEKEFGDQYFDSCTNLSTSSETEDYLFTVVKSCPASVISTTSITKCEGYTVPIKLRAKGSLATTEFKWYDAETGGTLLATTPVTSTTSTATNTEWTIPTISTTTTYYVEAVYTDPLGISSCTSNVRVPVTARINMIPNITFSTNDPQLCGDDDYVSITATGGNEIEYLLEEDFENGNMGSKFINQKISTNTDPNYDLSNWQYESSTFRRAQIAWLPAISSGMNGNGFVFSTADLNIGSVENALESINIPKSTNFNNLYLSFRMYFSKYVDDGDVGNDIVSIDVSTDNGANWTNDVHVISADVGIGTRFDLRTFDLSAYKNASNIQFRIRYKTPGWVDGVAVDDIKLYGERPLSTSFTWTSNNPIKVYSDAAATTEYVQGTPISTIYIKPTLDQLETYRNWQLNATANLTNGCDAKGTSSISSQTKVWNQSTDDWNVAADWKPVIPTPDVPSSLQCVIVRTPVNIYTAKADGIAKRVKVKLGGKLTIKTDRNLTVVEDLINEGAVGDVIVESNAGLIQRTSSSPNIGSITVKRDANLKRLDYNYWGSPVDGQNLKTFSPGTKNSRFYTYNTSNDLFDAIDPFANNFIPGKGYAIRASDFAPSTTNPLPVFHGEFKGVPNKGTITVPISDVGNGYNLVANPYPSNIDFEDLINPLLNNNSNIIYGTAYFWTNTNYNPQMQGANYPSNLPVGTQIINNYAVYNGTGGVGAPYASGTGNNNPVGTTTNCLSCTKPNRFIRPGQGFIVKAKAAGNLVFNDDVRAVGASAKFFNRSSSKISDESTDRFWLNLKNPLDFVNPLLIGYVKGASDNYELDYDAELLIYGGDSFYSILDDKKLAIQGKAYPFNENDVIPLGARFGMDGNYQISIDTPEGIFANGKNVFLKDKVTGVVTNLSENTYDFTVSAGESANRFEIFYVNSVLGTSEIEKNELSVYKNGNSFIIDSKEEINSIKLFDASGRIVFYKAIKGKTFNYSSDDLQNGVYVFEINISGKLYYKKIKK